MKTILRIMTDKQKIKSKDALIKALNELSTIVDELAEKVKLL
jgi:DNA-directed RNA polymerase subunit L